MYYFSNANFSQSSIKILIASNCIFTNSSVGNLPSAISIKSLLIALIFALNLFLSNLFNITPLQSLYISTHAILLIVVVVHLFVLEFPSPFH